MSACVGSFPLTADGYFEAVRWLKETGNYHKVEAEISMDGYTVVELANTLGVKPQQGAPREYCNVGESVC